MLERICDRRRCEILEDNGYRTGEESIFGWLTMRLDGNDVEAESRKKQERFGRGCWLW